MKPVWDKLQKEHADSNSLLVAEVDCTSETGRPLCQTHDIKSYPTIKWGEPSNLTQYKGKRDFDSLSDFARQNITPLCSPFRLDLCDETSKATYQSLIDMDNAQLNSNIAIEEEKIRNASNWRAILQALLNNRSRAAAIEKAKAEASARQAEHTTPESREEPPNPIEAIKFFAMYVLLPLAIISAATFIFMPILCRRRMKTTYGKID